MAFTKEQLKEVLDKKGIQYSDDATVPQLEQLLIDADQSNNSGDENASDNAPVDNEGETPVNDNEGDEGEDESEDENDTSEDDTTDEHKEDDEDSGAFPENEVSENDEKTQPIKENPPQPVGHTEVKPQAKPPIKDITNLYNKEIRKMKEWLWKQPKVKFMIPKSEHEKSGAFETWMRNGYCLKIMKGVYVDLPKPVADDLAIHYSIDMEAGKDFRLDGNPDKANALNA